MTENLEMLWSELRLILKTSSVTPDFFYVFYLILSFSSVSQSFEKICVGSFWARTSLRPEPIIFVRLDSEHAHSDGKSVNSGLPVTRQKRLSDM